MAIFSQGVLTKNGQALIAKAQADGIGITFTRAATGSGEYDSVDADTLEAMTALLNEEQEFAIASKTTISGNSGIVVLTIVINNEDLDHLYRLTEMGIFAEDPDDGEILYCLLATTDSTVYIPADGGSGSVSVITERVYVEVVNAGQTVIDSTGALASAADLEALQVEVEAAHAGLSGGDEGEMLIKQSSEDYDYAWTSINTVTRSYSDFPSEGREDAIYVDTDSSSIYVWKDSAYTKLALGADAAETLQSQITALSNEIEDLEDDVAEIETALSETAVTVPVSEWEEGESDGYAVYTQTVEVDGMTEDTDATLYPNITSTGAAEVLTELKAVQTFFSRGIAESVEGGMELTCYVKCPAADFGLLIKGV